jgi:two-component system chemotaxis response regulator CheB
MSSVLPNFQNPAPRTGSSIVAADRPIRVLIVDDSAVMREALTRALSSASDIEVVGTAPDPFVARDKIVRLSPDVVTLDVEMPRMDGITFLSRLMAARPIPVIVVSTLTSQGATTTLRALEAGAVDVVHKPGPDSTPEQLASQLTVKVRLAAKARPGQLSAGTSQAAAIETGFGGGRAVGGAQATVSRVPEIAWKRIVAIGASTGGVQALTAVLSRFPRHCPATLVVQHMPPRFTAAFAERLDGMCQCHVVEAQDGMPLQQGMIYLAPGGRHMVLRRIESGLAVALKDGPPVFHQKPAVEVLFDAVTRVTGSHAVGAILTGMGADGAAGLLRMRQSGARTFAEHESTAIVYGMPAEAVRLGAAEKVLPLDAMAAALLEAARS